jgi:hypothetical protein
VHQNDSSGMLERGIHRICALSSEPGVTAVLATAALFLQGSVLSAVCLSRLLAESTQCSCLAVVRDPELTVQNDRHAVGDHATHRPLLQAYVLMFICSTHAADVVKSALTRANSNA